MDYDQLARQLVKAYPKTIAYNPRVGRAIAVLKAGGVKRTGKSTFQVRSLSRPGLVHRVNLAKKSCDCEDATKGNVCFHRLASQLYLEGK